MKQSKYKITRQLLLTKVLWLGIVVS